MSSRNSLLVPKKVPGLSKTHKVQKSDLSSQRSWKESSWFSWVFNVSYHVFMKRFPSSWKTENLVVSWKGSGLSDKHLDFLKDHVWGSEIFVFVLDSDLILKFPHSSEHLRTGENFCQVSGLLESSWAPENAPNVQRILSSYKGTCRTPQSQRKLLHSQRRVYKKKFIEFLKELTILLKCPCAPEKVPEFLKEDNDFIVTSWEIVFFHCSLFNIWLKGFRPNENCIKFWGPKKVPDKFQVHLLS